MEIFIKTAKYSLTSCVVILFFLALAGVNANRQQKQKEDIKQPPIISKVESLEIINTEIKGWDESTAFLEITIRNNTDKPVISIGVEASDGKDAVGTNVNGFEEGDKPPLVILEPFSTITVKFSLSNMKHVKPGTPVKIGGVMFADGTEEGDKDTLGTMHRQKEHYKAKKQ